MAKKTRVLDNIGTLTPAYEKELEQAGHYLSHRSYGPGCSDAVQTKFRTWQTCNLLNPPMPQMIEITRTTNFENWVCNPGFTINMMCLLTATDDNRTTGCPSTYPTVS